MATCGPYESPSSWPPFHDPHLRLFLLPIQNLICHIVFVLIVSFAPAACNCPHRRRSEGRSVMASRSKAAAPKRKKTKRRREEGRVGTTGSSSRCHCHHHRRVRAPSNLVLDAEGRNDGGHFLFSSAIATAVWGD